MYFFLGIVSLEDSSSLHYLYFYFSKQSWQTTSRAQSTTATADDLNGDSDDEEGVFVVGTNTAFNNADVEIAPNGNYSVDVIVHDGVTPIPLVPTGVPATVSGNVYNDYDNDGTQEINNGASDFFI